VTKAPNDLLEFLKKSVTISLDVHLRLQNTQGARQSPTKISNLPTSSGVDPLNLKSVVVFKGIAP